MIIFHLPKNSNSAVKETVEEKPINTGLLSSTVKDIFDSGLKEPKVANMNQPKQPGSIHTFAVMPPKEEKFWFYKDPLGNVQGPFGSDEMTEFSRLQKKNSNFLVEKLFS